MSFTSRRRVAMTAAAALSALALAACGSSDSGSSSESGSSAAADGAPTLLKSGVLQVCTHLSYKPFQFKDDSGKVVGFDVDVMDLVAKKLGATQEIVDIDFAQITSGAVFAAKKCDAGAAATTINDKRKQAILFSDPYFDATQALLVKKDSGITDLSGLKGKKIGVQTDTTGADYTEKNKDANGYEVVVFDDLLFWTKDDERVGQLKAEYGDQLEIIYTSNDGSFGIKGFVTGPLEELLKANKKGKGREIAEVVTIGPPLMMRAVSDLTKPYGVKTVASLNSIMVDATGMCGACMVPVTIDGKMVRKHACVDGPEIDSHIIDWDKFLPRFNQFKPQEMASKVKHGLA